MSVTPENDPDGVDRAGSAEVHENTRHSEEGVEETPVTGERAPSPGIVGNGQGADPRYIGQR